MLVISGNNDGDGADDVPVGVMHRALLFFYYFTCVLLDIIHETGIKQIEQQLMYICTRVQRSISLLVYSVLNVLTCSAFVFMIINA